MLDSVQLPRAKDAATRQVGPVAVHVRSQQEALADIMSALRARSGLRVAFANTHLAYHAMKDARLQAALGGFYLLNDGVGMTFLSLLTSGAAFVENLNGTDFTPQLLEAAPAGARVFLVGAKPRVAAAAAERIRCAFPHLTVCGVRGGYSAWSSAKAEVFAALQIERPQLVLAAMGNPLQEEWIAEAAAFAPDAVFIGVGALFDYLSGAVERAPKSIQRLRLEWLYRLMREPRRLGRRYSIEFAVLFLHCLGHRLGLRRGAVA